MSNPAAHIGDMTDTGDTIVGPGISTVLIGGQPASIMGDQIVCNACTGSIIAGSPTSLIGGVPAARVTSIYAGLSSGGTASSTIVAQGAPTVLIR